MRDQSELLLCVFVPYDLPSSADSSSLCQSQCTSRVSSLCPNHGEVIACVTSTEFKTTCSLTVVICCVVLFIGTLGPCWCLLRHSVLVVVYCNTRSLLVFIGTLGPCWCLLGHSVLVVVYWDTRSLLLFIRTLGYWWCLLRHSVLGGVYWDTRCCCLLVTWSAG